MGLYRGVYGSGVQPACEALGITNNGYFVWRITVAEWNNSVFNHQNYIDMLYSYETATGVYTVNIINANGLSIDVINGYGTCVIVGGVHPLQGTIQLVFH